MKPIIRSVGLVVAVGLSMSACADVNPSGTTSPENLTTAALETTTTLTNLGGDGRQVQNTGETYLHPGAQLSGTLVLEDNGCWKIAFAGESRIVAFPRGFTMSDSGVAMIAPDGVEYGDGLAVDAVGGPSSVDGLPGVPDGYWDGLVSFCDPAAIEIVVLDEMKPAVDPSAMTETELIELVDTAVLSESWPCGLGFTLSTFDQRVVLYTEPTDLYVESTPPITFPNPAWSGRVVVGKNLLVNHCDDVVEYWEPEAVPAATWELTAGVLDFEPPAEVGFDACGTSDAVRAALAGALIQASDGPISLGDLTVVNEAYGCFAG